MFHFFLLTVVLYYVLFFSLAARYIRQFAYPHEQSEKLIWRKLFHLRH